MKFSLLVLATAGLLAPAVVASAQAPLPPGATLGSQDGADPLAAIFEGPTHPVTGTVAVVVLDDDGPFVSELDVSVTAAGDMAVGRSRSFAIGRDGDDAFLAKDGTLLRLGAVIAEDDPYEAMYANYTGVRLDTTTLDTGPADGFDLLDKDGVLRERLWVDQASGVVVRRETYDLQGRPRRLVAFTELTLVAEARRPSRMPDSGRPSPDVFAESGPVAELEAKALGTLAKTGWQVPDELPGGFALTRGFALDNGGGHSSLHLVYTDGLYTTSIYQQPGDVSDVALDGAVFTEDQGLAVWRWPGAQPERVLWSSHGMTFTAVGDATTDHLLASLTELPRGERDAIGSRLRRGLVRVGSWINPFR